MTKEEIREGIEDIIDKITGDYLPYTQRWVLRDHILNYLDSCGVVLKVDDQTVWFLEASEAYKKGVRDMVDAGYVKTERLV